MSQLTSTTCWPIAECALLKELLRKAHPASVNIIYQPVDYVCARSLQPQIDRDFPLLHLKCDNFLLEYVFVTKEYLAPENTPK